MIGEIVRDPGGINSPDGVGHPDSPGRVLVEGNGFSLKDAGFRIPETSPGGMFAVKFALSEGIREFALRHNLSPEAVKRLASDWSVGSPTSNPIVWALQRNMIFGDEPSADQREQLHPAVRVHERLLMDEVIPEMSTYSDRGGGKKYQESMLREYGLAEVLTTDNIAITGGGTEGAILLVDDIIKLSVPTSDGPSLREKIVVDDPADARWQDILPPLLTTHETQDYFHLEIHNTDLIPEAVRIKLIRAVKKGHIVVVDVRDRAVTEHSLIMSEVGASTLIVDNKPEAITGVSAVIGDRYFVDAVNGEHLKIWGTPPSSMSSRRFLAGLSAEELASLSRLTDDEISVIASEYPGLAKIIDLHRHSASYILAMKGAMSDGTGSVEAMEEAEGAREALTRLVTESRRLTEESFLRLFGEMLGNNPSLKALLVHGAARGALNEHFLALLFQTYSSPKPSWPTFMAVPRTMSAKEIGGAFKNGRLDTGVLLPAVEGILKEKPEENLVLVLEDVSNPQGTNHDPDTVMSPLLRFAHEWNTNPANRNKIIILSDMMYVTYTRKGQPPATVYLKKAYLDDMLEVVVATFSFSKDVGGARLRIGVCVGENEVYMQKIRKSRDRIRPGGLSILLAEQLISEPGAFWNYVAWRNADNDSRRERKSVRLNDAGINFVPPDAGYYFSDVPIPLIDTSNNPQLAAEWIARNLLVAVVPMDSFKGQTRGVRYNGVRSSIGGPLYLGNGVDASRLDGLKPDNVDKLLDFDSFDAKVDRLVELAQYQPEVSLEFDERGQLKNPDACESMKEQLLKRLYPELSTLAT